MTETINAEAVVALCALCVTMLASLIAVVWRAGSLVAELRLAVDTVRTDQGALRNALSALTDIPVIRQRLETVEKFQVRIASDHRQLKEAFIKTDTRVRLQSFHDIEGDE